MAPVARSVRRFNLRRPTLGFSKDWFLIPIAAVIGILAGLIATGFEWLVNASLSFFFGTLTQREFFLSDYLLLILLPATGGLAVGMIQQYIARTGPTHGVPEVIEALARKNGRMPIRMGLFKTITASLTIGSGGSGGVEGPIIQTGSVLGSLVGQWLRVSREHMQTLVGCGAAAGMAGIFNAPIAGVLFVLEVLLRDFSIKTFIPIVVASVFGTAVAQSLHGENIAVFHVDGFLRTYQVDLMELWAFALLGVACGLLGIAFIRAQYLSENLWNKLNAPKALKPALGGVSLGLMGIIFVLTFGQPFDNYEPPAFFSNGYPVTEMLLNPGTFTDMLTTSATASITIPLLLTLIAFKLVGTCMTIGSGGSGGFIAPSLFIGATLGAACGLILETVGFLPTSNPATYALAGMAGVIAATMHAPLTAFLLVFEITQDYRVILPVMLVAIVATTVCQVGSRDSIYGLWLRKRGIRVGNLSDMVLLRRIQVADVLLMPPVIVRPHDPAQKLVDLANEYAPTDYVVCDQNNEYLGMVVGADMRTTLVQREAIPLMIVQELMRTEIPTVHRQETLDEVLDKFSRYDVASLTVVDHTMNVRGIITRSRLMRHYQQALDNA